MDTKFADLSGPWGYDLVPLADQGIGAVWRAPPFLPVLRTGPASTGGKVRMFRPPLVRLVRGGIILDLSTDEI